jgi:hypothetical protein
LRAAFSHDQDRAAPFTSKPDTLHQTQQHEQQRRKYADRFVVGQEADEQRCDTCQQKCRDQRRFAADAADMTGVSRLKPTASREQCFGAIALQRLALSRELTTRE